VSEARARPYTDADAARWDAFVAGAARGTLLQTRRFLGYHGARFDDRSVVVERDGRWEAVIPAATHPSRPAEVLSHPGATWGGVLTQKLNAARITEDALAAAGAHWRAQGATTATFRMPLAHLSAQPDEGDVHALLRLGARPERADLWSVVHLDRPLRRDDVASARRGQRLGVTVSTETDAPAYADFHALLAATLRARHDARPVHSPAELLDLRERLGPAQELWTARLPDGTLGAGAWLLWHRGDVAHTQYLAASDAARESRCLDVLLDALVERLRGRARCLSFGTSTEDEGRVLNAPLLAFKSKFGGGGALQHFLRWSL
jgi:hypothetical protein